MEEQKESTNIDNADHSVENNDTPKIIYKKERNPFVKFAIKFVVIFSIFIALLFGIGFVMGLSNYRPPTLDFRTVENQWNRITNKDSQPPSELERATPSPTPSITAQSGDK